MAVDTNTTSIEREPPLPIRLAYDLELTGRSSSVRLTACAGGDGPRLGDSDLKQMLPRLHALDQVIVRELRGGLVFGQIGEAGLARLLPLLVQRKTRVAGRRLVLSSEGLRPRIRVQPGPAATVEIAMGLQGAGQPWLELGAGRLIAGSSAFFLWGDTAYPVESPAAWELGNWSKTPVRNLGSGVTPAERDQLVRDLTRAGVPSEDLEALAVRRGPPDTVRVRLLPPRKQTGELRVHVAVEAAYDDEWVSVAGQRPASPHVIPAGGGQMRLIERDLAMEEELRRALRHAGFRWDRDAEAFAARGEVAIRALDPEADVFPPQWEIDRSQRAPLFHRDLGVRAQVRLLEERGLLDVSVDVTTSDPRSDEAQVAALVDLKDLLAWLHSGKRYIQLKDGSFAAPSQRFRRNLRLLGDLGADSGRALVSPLCVGLLRALGDGAALAAADASTRAWIEELSGASRPLPVTPPDGLGQVFRDYQARGIDWLAMLHRHRLTGILADDMGLGKTLQALALLLWAREREGSKPSLIVAPTSVVSVWRDEAERFTPQLSVALWHGPPAVRQAIDVDSHDLVVTSYGVLRRDADLLASHGFRYVILDEAQSAKNAATQNARAVRRIKSERRLALTGTPIENRPEELWAAFDFLAPGFLGNLRQFRKRYARPIGQGDEHALGLLRARIQPLVLRRLKSEVASELPPRVESTVRCDMLPQQRALYEHVAGELRESVKRKIERVGIERAHLEILAALTRLRQICCDPALLPAPKDVKVPGSAKLELFGELMREALESERRVVVFSQFVQMQKRLIAVIRKLGVDPLWLHGGTRDRAKVVAQFQDPDGPPVIVVSLRAGGTGVTLTRADTVMHFDPWWNPAVERQASDRAHRLGQRHQVNIYKLVCARSIEERVVSMAAAKDALADELLGSEGGAHAKHITPEEVLALLG